MYYTILRKYERHLVIILLLSIGSLTAYDVIEDLLDGTYFHHLLLDIAIAFASFLLVLILIQQVLYTKNKIKVLEKERLILTNLSENLMVQSRTLIEGLSVIIDSAFEEWHLSTSEREIALFLLKGLSTDEIANIRGSSEKTIRNQAASIYKKSKISSRQEFQAYFLEDLLIPMENNAN